MKILGNYAELAEEIADSCQYPGSFLDPKWQDVAVWQREMREKVAELLAYHPAHPPLNPRLLERFEYDGLSVELITWDQRYGPPTEAFFLKPLKPLDAGAGAALPGVVALHDHGGFKYYGKEKLAPLPEEPEILREWKARCYGGASWAARLAKRGYGVLVPDIFLWGSRRMRAEAVPPEFTETLRTKEPGSRAYIEAYNTFCRDYESIIAKSLFMAGTTWPGVMADETIRAVDYLCTRRDIDPERIGCGGLSGGGEQGIFLTCLDPRIRCTVCACFMTTFAQTVRHNIHSHTWMFHVPHLAGFLDLPDVLSLGAIPVLVQYGEQDPLFADAGKRESNAKLRSIYEKMGRPDHYEGRFYPGGHQFDLLMQDDAFAWFDRWLT